MRKSRRKGEPFEELSVVKSAGFSRGKRRDKSINKKAGLHDKKVAEDETRVRRRKPLAVKHKRRLRKAIPALLAILSIAMVIIISGSFKPPVKFDDLEGDYRTVYLETPKDNSSPEDHTVVETIGYLNYTLQNQPYWSSDMAQSLTAMLNIKQNTYNYKKYYNNTLISVDIAKGASTSARQFCQTDKVVLWRDAVDASNTNKFYTNWKTGKPSGLTISEFKKKRGLPPKDFSVYVLNENTILNAQEKSIKSNGDGTYTFTADLNVNTKSGEENNACSAVYYYKQQMAVTGGLSQLPTYTYTNVTYVFDENYRVLSFEINDSYKATMRIPGLGEPTSPCTSTTRTTFSYELEDCKNSVYDEFKGYLNDFTAGGDETQEFAVNATNCLAGAFASVLSDGAVFKLDLDLGGRTVGGALGVSLKDGGLDSVSAKLGNITVHVLEEKGGYVVYLALGGSKYKLNISELDLPSAMKNTGISSTGGDEGGDLLSGILDSLFEGEFIYDSESGLATLHSNISLFGVEIEIKFAFSVNEEAEEISLIDVNAIINYKNISVGAKLEFGDEKDRPADLTNSAKAQYTDILNDGITAGVDLTLGEKVISGIAKIDLDGGNLVGVRAKLGNITVHYEGDSLYIAIGDSKYMLALNSLGGEIALPQGLNGNFNFTLSDLLESIAIENGIIKAQIFGADISLDLFSEIKATVNLNKFGGIGVDAYLTTEKAPAKLTEQAKTQYVDILNDGITVGVDLTLGEKVVSGVAKIDLDDGNFVGVHAKLGNITVHYDGSSLYMAIGDSKYLLDLDSLGGDISLSEGFDFDFNTILSKVLEGITIEDGIINVQLAGADIWAQLADINLNASVDLLKGITASTFVDKFGGVGVNAYLTTEKAPAKLTEQEKAGYVDILNEGITVSVSLTLGGKLINGVAKIDLDGGNLVGVRAKLGDAVVHYADDILYISVSGSKIKLPASVFGETASSADSFDIKSLIKDIINGIHIDSGIITTQLFGADISIDIFENATVDLAYELFGTDLSVSANLSNSDSAPAQLTYSEKADYVDVIEGFSLTGVIDLTLGGEQISLEVNNLAISFENSLSFKLDAILYLNNTYNNFYIEYTDGVLVVTYGTVHFAGEDSKEGVLDAVTVKLDIGNGDLDALGEVVVTIYNRVIAVYNEIAKQNVQAANELTDILTTLGISNDGVRGLQDILDKLAIPTVDGKLDMGVLLKSIVLSATSDGISVGLGNVLVDLALKGSGAYCNTNITIDTSSYGITISNATVHHYLDFEVPCENPLDKDGFVDMLDFLGATAEMLLQHTITLNLAGTIYNYNGQYTDYGDVKYKFNAFLEYDDGGSMPVTFEDGQLYVSNDLYLHAKLDLAAQNTAVDKSLYLDVYILDGYPNGTNDDGFTTGGYTPDGTGLDFYVSISEFESGGNPLKFYGSMNEVLSLGAMGVAMLNLQDVNTESEQVNSAVASIYALLNTMLIQNYIPSVKSQFESLGESLVPNILGSDLSTMLNKVIDSLEGILNGSDNSDKELTEGNFIKKATCENGRIDVALNSATLFGVPEYNDLTFYITKTAGEKALISSLGINNIYFNENGLNKLDFAATFDYSSKSRPNPSSAFKDYHNFEGFDKLLLMAVGSATHETTEEERAEGYFADYKLNNDYCVDGNVTVNMKLLGLDLVSIPIAINALHINIDENNEVSADVNLSYKKLSVLLTKIITDTATVDISVRKGMIYIRKAISGGTTSYRIMPAETFGADTYNQIAYILSFSDTVNQIADSFGSTTPIYPTFTDYGDYISNFITRYKYAESGNSNEWIIDINKTTLGNLAGMSNLGTITVGIKGDNGVLRSLSVSGSLSVITFSGELNYINPNEKFIAGKEDKSIDVANLVPGNLNYSWADILGGGTFAEIDKHFKWSAVAGGKTGYIEYESGDLTFGGYKYFGASYKTDSGYGVGTLDDLIAMAVFDAKLDAIWIKVDINRTINRTTSGGIFNRSYSYSLGLNSFSFDIIANEELLSDLTVEDAITFGYLSNSAAYEPNIKSNRVNDIQLELMRDGDTFECTLGTGDFANPGFPDSALNYGHVVVAMNLVFGKNKLEFVQHEYKKF